MTPYDAPEETRPGRGADFVYGFAGALLACIFCGGLIALQGNPGTLSFLPCMLAVAGMIVVIVMAFHKKRRFIAFGILTVLGILVAIPLLLVGACFVAFSRGGL